MTQPFRSDREFQRHVLHSLERIEESLKEIRNSLGRRARSATIRIINHEGEIIMPLTVHLNDAPGQAVFTEFDGANGTGNKVPPVGNISFASSDQAVAAVDPNTGALAYVSAGSCTISGTDQGNGLTASDTLTVVASTAVSATLTLVPGPIAQKPAA